MKPFWEPTAERVTGARVTQYMRWLADHPEGQEFDTYESLWQWSVNDIENFWRSVWEYFQVDSSAPVTEVLENRKMPGANWFPGTQVNYVNQVFRHKNPDQPAIIFEDEAGDTQELSWDDLEKQVACFSAELKRLGVEPGDRVAAFLPNRPEAIVAFLACANLGAIWSLCSPDMGATSVLDRFRQIEPKVLIACDGYTYNGKIYDRSGVVEQIREKLPSLENFVFVPVLRSEEHTSELQSRPH